jgi:uncharacterized surface protein with fasciclin (FAS1) repeats
MNSPIVKRAFGKALTLRAAVAGVTVNHAQAVATGLVGRNGVIHAVDAVLRP